MLRTLPPLAWLDLRAFNTACEYRRLSLPSSLAAESPGLTQLPVSGAHHHFFFRDTGKSTLDAAVLLRHGRRQAGLSQRALADAAGIPQSRVARIESRRSAPRFDEVALLLSVCGLGLGIHEEPQRGWPIQRDEWRRFYSKPIDFRLRATLDRFAERGCYLDGISPQAIFDFLRNIEQTGPWHNGVVIVGAAALACFTPWLPNELDGTPFEFVTDTDVRWGLLRASAIPMSPSGKPLNGYKRQPMSVCAPTWLATVGPCRPLAAEAASQLEQYARHDCAGRQRPPHRDRDELRLVLRGSTWSSRPIDDYRV